MEYQLIPIDKVYNCIMHPIVNNLFIGFCVHPKQQRLELHNIFLWLPIIQLLESHQNILLTNSKSLWSFYNQPRKRKKYQFLVCGFDFYTQTL